MSKTCYYCKFAKPRYDRKDKGIFPFNSYTISRYFVCTFSPPTGNGFPMVASSDSCSGFEESSPNVIRNRELEERMM